MNLEEDLRVTLRDRAEAAMPPSDLLNDVTDGVRRDKRRRRLTASSAAAVTVIAAVAVPAFVRDDREPPRPRPLPATSVSPSPSGSWSGPQTPSTTFPLRPGWVPEGMGQATVFQLGPNALLQYEKKGDILSAEIGPIKPDGEVETTGKHSATVGGRPATVYTADSYDGAGPGDRYFRVVWRITDPEWAQVLSFGRRGEADVLRFAGELGADGLGPVSAGPAPFGFKEVPGEWMAPQHVSPESVCLAPARETARWQRMPEGLCVAMLQEAFDPLPTGERVTVGGREGILSAGAGSLTVDFGAGRVLSISWNPEELPLSRDDVLRFAGGITYRR